MSFDSDLFKQKPSYNLFTKKLLSCSWGSGFVLEGFFLVLFCPSSCSPQRIKVKETVKKNWKFTLCDGLVKRNGAVEERRCNNLFLSCRLEKE